MTLSCRRAGKLIDLAVDGLATPEQRAALDAHLLTCDRCRRTSQQLHALQTALDDLFPDQEEALPPDVLDAARSALAKSRRGP